MRAPPCARRRPLGLAGAPVLEEGDASLQQPSPEESPGFQLWAAEYLDPTWRRLPFPSAPAGSGAPVSLPRPRVELASHCKQEMSPIPPNFGLLPPILASQEMENRARPLPEAP